MAIEIVVPQYPSGQYQPVGIHLEVEEQPTMILPIMRPQQETRGYQRWYSFEATQGHTPLRPLEIQSQAFITLRKHLRFANKWNRRFKSQYAHLEKVLWEATEMLRFHFANEIDQVILVSGDLLAGIDLRELGYDDVVLAIVLRGNKRPYRLYRAIAVKVFSQLDRSQFLPQFRLIGAADWQAVVQRATEENRVPQLGLTLLRRV